jgi:hypothetical protein
MRAIDKFKINLKDKSIEFEDVPEEQKEKDEQN